MGKYLYNDPENNPSASLRVRKQSRNTWKTICQESCNAFENTHGQKKNTQAS